MQNLHLYLCHRAPTQEPGQGRDRICKRERARASEGEKRFQDISSLRLEGVLEMRWGGWRCEAGGIQWQGQDSWGGSGLLFHLITASSEATGDLVSYSVKWARRKKAQEHPLLSRQSCYNSIKAVTQRWGQLMSDTGETPSQINYPLHRLLKRLLNCNLPEIVIIPSVIEHKRERARSISICARINNGSLVIASIKKKEKNVSTVRQWGRKRSERKRAGPLSCVSSCLLWRFLIPV